MCKLLASSLGIKQISIAHRHHHIMMNDASKNSYNTQLWLEVSLAVGFG
jgi:hypothetical protein